MPWCCGVALQSEALPAGWEGTKKEHRRPQRMTRNTRALRAVRAPVRDEAVPNKAGHHGPAGGWRVGGVHCRVLCCVLCSWCPRLCVSAAPPAPLLMALPAAAARSTWRTSGCCAATRALPRSSGWRTPRRAARRGGDGRRALRISFDACSSELPQIMCIFSVCGVAFRTHARMVGLPRRTCASYRWHPLKP